MSSCGVREAVVKVVRRFFELFVWVGKVVLVEWNQMLELKKQSIVGTPRRNHCPPVWTCVLWNLGAGG